MSQTGQAQRAPNAAPASTPTSAPSPRQQNGNEERTSNNRRGRRGRRGGRGNGQRRQTPTETFKGNTEDMNGHVFQTHGETTNRQQYADTVEALAQYINKHLKYPGDVVTLCKSGKIPTITEPANLSSEEKENDAKQLIWTTEVQQYVKRKGIQISNTHAIHAVIWGQCSPTMQAKLKSLPSFEDKDENCDAVWLLQAVKGITHLFEGTRYLMLSLTDALGSFYNCKQKRDETLHEYLKNFRAAVEILDHYGASVGEDKAMLRLAEKLVGDKKPNETDADAMEAYEKKVYTIARGRCLSVVFLKGADRTRFGALWADLENQFTRGNDQYPTDLTAAYNLLTNFQSAHPRQSNTSNNDTTQSGAQSGLSFLQHGEPQAGTDGTVHAHITCFNCNKKGHYASQCPEQRETGVTLLQSLESAGDDDDDPEPYMFTFAQVDNRFATIPSSWILLDSQSTVSVFRNKKLLVNVRDSGQTLKVHTNGGSQISSKVGDIRNFGTVWYNPASLANILSMAEVRKVCRITMDTNIEPAMCVHRKDGTTMKFLEYSSGLYYHDVKSNSTSSATVQAYMPDYSFVTTVEQNKALFSKAEVAGAEKARRLYKQIGPPSQQRFEHILANNLIQNCPVTVDDAKRAHMIFGPDAAATKGKQTNKGPSHVPTILPLTVPAPILDMHPSITLCIDILYINGVPFLHTTARKLQFKTIAHIQSRQKRVLLKEVQDVVRLYEGRGFSIACIHADQEFACLQSDMRPTLMNIADADDHVPEVERSIRTIKERVRAQVHDMPYARVPKTMVKAMAHNAVRNLNLFPPTNGLSNTMSPLTIMTGQPPPDYKVLQLNFGDYAQVFEERPTTNTNRNRSTGAIALYPTGNLQGGYYFMSLATGERISRRQWTCIPIPEGVIQRMEELGKQDKQPIMRNGEPVFEWAPGEEMADELDRTDLVENVIDTGADRLSDLTLNMNEPPDDRSETPNVVPDDESVGSMGSIATQPHLPEGDTVVTDQSVGAAEEHERGDSDDSVVIDECDAQQSDTDPDETIDDVQDTTIGDEPVLDGASDLGVETEASEVEVETVSDHDEEPDTDDQGLEKAYNLRSNRERSYVHRLDNQMDNPDSSKSYRNIQFLQVGDKNKASLAAQRFVTGFILNQMTATAGIKKHGEKAVEALYNEFAQLNDKTVFDALHASTLTRRQKREALRIVNLIKEKRSGKLKGRTCADGRPQRAKYTKEETASPTVTTEALLLSLMIDAMERRDVACADVAGAYLLADMDTFTIVVMTGEAVDIMCKVNPSFTKYVTIENGKKTLYLRLVKALYGCVRSALLWYELFSSTLQKMGFELNPYDPCVANKVIDGSQCTIAWYVDDNKISHKDPQVVTDIIKEMEGHFGKMVVTRGNKHNFLGMDVEIVENGTVKIRAKQYLEEAIEAFGEEITKDAPTPATQSLFNLDRKSKRLDEERSDRFHRIVAKLLYICKRARLDIQLPIAFLCTRVAKSTEQDWEKLRRVLQYVRATIDDVFILGADDISMAEIWADAAFAVHDDMKSHTGGGVSFGRGTILSMSAKQKLNTKSSTEAELVGASDVLPSAIWLMRFLEGQGYEIKRSVFHQDNKSAIKLEKNGRKSAGKKSRHIDIRYFFIKDRVATEGISIEYCPTERMVADFFTKPLQGSLFRKLRAVVMGHEHVKTLLDDVDSTTTTKQERVGNSEEKGSVEDALTDDDTSNKDATDNLDNGNSCIQSERESCIEREQAKRSYAEVLRG